MKRSELEKLIKEAIEANMPAEKVQGSINLNLLKQLDPNLNPTLISTAISKVRNGAGLSVTDNKTLAELMTSLIKTSDDALLAKIFANFKQIQAK